MLGYTTLLTLSLLATGSLSASCSGVVGLIASAVAGIPEAQTYCSNKFPASVNTISVTVGGSAVTSTVATNTVTTTQTTAT